MNEKKASVHWEGAGKKGQGRISTETGVLKDAPYGFATRFEDDKRGTNPEELIGAAHASCFSMFLAASLGKAGFSPKSVATDAVVHLGTVDGGPTITKIELHCVAYVPEIDAATFAAQAEGAKKGCPISKALSAVAEVTLDAKLA